MRLCVCRLCAGSLHCEEGVLIAWKAASLAGTIKKCYWGGGGTFGDDHPEKPNIPYISIKDSTELEPV